MGVGQGKEVGAEVGPMPPDSVVVFVGGLSLRIMDDSKIRHVCSAKEITSGGRWDILKDRGTSCGKKVRKRWVSSALEGES